MKAGGKIRRRYDNLPPYTGPVYVMRAFGVLTLVAFVAVAVAAFVRGDVRWGITELAVALVVGAVIASQSRFIRDRKAGRPL